MTEEELQKAVAEKYARHEREYKESGRPAYTDVFSEEEEEDLAAAWKRQGIREGLWKEEDD